MPEKTNKVWFRDWKKYTKAIATKLHKWLLKQNWNLFLSQLKLTKEN